MLREGGASSTLRLLDSIMGASGILVRPPSRTMTATIVIASPAKQSIARQVEKWIASLRSQ